MKCAWQAYINLLPLWTRSEINHYINELLETRLRVGCLPELITINGRRSLNRCVCEDDLSFVINSASRYSPWAAETASSGFITTYGGHRVGICGIVACHNDQVTGIRKPSSLCIRVAREFPGISGTLANMDCSLLIIGPPGSGKTTLLRDLVRQRSDKGKYCVAVVDERAELFPISTGESIFHHGKSTDVLTGCKKECGINMVMRSMNPGCIAVDEITQNTDCDALLQAGWCGVSILATAHAGNIQDLLSRPIYAPIVKYKLFQKVVVLKRDKTWTLEDMPQ